MGKQLEKKIFEDSKNVLRQKYTWIHSKQLLKNNQIGKPRAMMAYMDTALKNYFSSMTNWQSKSKDG